MSLLHRNTKRALVLLIAAASPAWASPPAEERGAAEALVRAAIIAPLSSREARRSAFSRARPAPTQRRVRILDEAPLRDGRGRGFLRFAIDVRGGYLDLDETEAQRAWLQGDVVGCVYVDSRDVLVRRADRHYPAALLLGAKVPAADEAACMPVSTVADLVR